MPLSKTVRDGDIGGMKIAWVKEDVHFVTET